jgi:hypothetical protein
MKQRLLVMNGQRLVQSEEGGQWVNAKVEKAHGLTAGIYNIHTATPADQAQAYDGRIIHADKERIYQQIGTGKFIVHDRLKFDKVPEVGYSLNIQYRAGRAQIQAATQLGQKRGFKL